MDYKSHTEKALVDLDFTKDGEQWTKDYGSYLFEFIVDESFIMRVYEIQYDSLKLIKSDYAPLSHYAESIENEGMQYKISNMISEELTRLNRRIEEFKKILLDMEFEDSTPSGNTFIKETDDVHFKVRFVGNYSIALFARSHERDIKPCVLELTWKVLNLQLRSMTSEEFLTNSLDKLKECKLKNIK